jgi:hypothetical protein
MFFKMNTGNINIGEILLTKALMQVMNVTLGPLFPDVTLGYLFNALASNNLVWSVYSCVGCFIQIVHFVWSKFVFFQNPRQI